VEVMAHGPFFFLAYCQQGAHERGVARTGADDEVAHPQPGEMSEGASAESGIGGHTPSSDLTEFRFRASSRHSRSERLPSTSPTPLGRKTSRPSHEIFRIATRA